MADSSRLPTVPTMTNRIKKVLITVAALAALALGGSAHAGAAAGSGSEAGGKSEAISGDAKATAERPRWPRRAA
jgi:hypothetical protein